LIYKIKQLKANQVLKILNISRPTLVKYHQTGLIKIDATINSQHVFNEDSVYALIGKRNKKHKKVNVSYSRVSTQSQKNQLKEQSTRILQSCIVKNIQLEKQFEDIKSGMSSDRLAFNEMLALIYAGKVEIVVIENKDRLVRFGFDMIENIFKMFGTTILVLNESIEDKTYEQELTEDLISIIHYFTMKSYSHRRKLNKLRKEIEQTSK
jgi:predicted site-specific integrase-resolvase